MRRVWAVIRREFVERLRSRWFWISAVLGPLFFGAMIFLPLLFTGPGGIKRIVVIDGTTTRFGARVADSLDRGSTFAVVARVSPRAGLMDSLAQQVGLHRLEGFLFVKDATVETGAAEYRAANVSAFRDVAELQGVLGRLAVNERLERAGVDPATVSRAQLRIRLETKKIAGANLARNWVMIPHVTQFDEADITDLEALRVQLNKENEKAGIKVTLLAFLIKACVAALKKYPEFNASLEGDNLVLKKYFHIGFAADTPNGLVVPVIRDADRKGVLEIAQETASLAGKAREGKLSPADMQGGSMSISSLGGIGGTAFTPIINAPEVAILGVSKSLQKPVWDGKQFAPRLVVPLSLSYDHRVIDGAAAARFTAFLTTLLADMRRAML